MFPTASGRPRDKENISRRVLGPTVKRANELRAERDLPPLPQVTPHALRRTYISLMIEAGAPLPYVMSHVGHADSRTTLEIYAQVQKRLSRKGVHRAFDDLLANAGKTEIEVPTDAGGKMSQVSVEAGCRRRRNRLIRTVCWSAWSTLWSTEVKITHPRMTLSQLSHKKSPAKRGFLRVEPAGIEPATSCLQRARDLYRLWAGFRFSANPQVRCDVRDRLRAQSRRKRLP